MLQVRVCGIGCFIRYSVYCVGLTKFVEVIKERDSSSLHPPTIFTNLANATLWTVYGYFAINDVNIYAPNGVGLILSVIQLILSQIFPRKQSSSSKQGGTAVSTDVSSKI
jgi:uncharacterized protein with PQ loop repeat